MGLEDPGFKGGTGREEGCCVVFGWEMCFVCMQEDFDDGCVLSCIAILSNYGRQK